MKYKIAIVGCGGIGGFHVRAIKDLEADGRAVLGGASDFCPGRADEFCAANGGQGFDDLETMLDQLKPDVLCVTTPSGAHLGPVKAAAARGIHVICEKPLEVSADRMSQLLAACNEGGVQLGAIFQQRMGPLMCTLHDAVAAGRFGDNPLIQASVPWWRDDDYYGPDRWQGTLKLDGGGALMNQSIHVVDLVLWLARAGMNDLSANTNPAMEVSCIGGVFGHGQDLLEVEDTAMLNIKLRDGRPAQILASTAMYPGSMRRFLVAGRDGTAEILEDQLLQWTFRNEQEEDEQIKSKFSGATTHGGGAGDPFALDYVNHRENISAFLTALDSGQTPALNGALARQAVDVILAAYESLHQGGVPVAVQ